MIQTAGRPPKGANKREASVKLSFTSAEFDMLTPICSQLNKSGIQITLSELLRRMVLASAEKYFKQDFYVKVPISTYCDLKTAAKLNIRSCNSIEDLIINYAESLHQLYINEFDKFIHEHHNNTVNDMNKLFDWHIEAVVTGATKRNYRLYLKEKREICKQIIDKTKDISKETLTCNVKPGAVNFNTFMNKYLRDYDTQHI